MCWFLNKLKHHHKIIPEQGKLEGGLSPDVFWGLQVDGPMTRGGERGL